MAKVGMGKGEDWLIARFDHELHAIGPCHKVAELLLEGVIFGGWC